jgi:hypothetical protein
MERREGEGSEEKVEVLRRFEVKYCFGRPPIILSEKEADTYIKMVRAVGKSIHTIKEIK